MMKTLLSIGACCKTRHQIDRFLNLHNQQSAVTSYFFDSLTGGNVEGVTNIIERDFVIRPEDICIFEYDKKFVPGDRASKLLFFHDFGTRHDYWQTHLECEAALTKAFEDSMQKYVYLGKKTLDLLSGNKDLCLLYYGRGRDDLFAKLQQVLHSKFGKQFMIVHVVDQEEELRNCDGTIPTIFIDEDNSPKFGTPHQWEGWDEAWQAALTTLFEIEGKNGIT